MYGDLYVRTLLPGFILSTYSFSLRCALGAPNLGFRRPGWVHQFRLASDAFI
jgi:hypothetical protein